MSVCLFFVNPSNSYERSFNIPIATEDVYRRLWVPKATKLETKLILRFGLGIEIGEEDVPKILSELSLLNADVQQDTQMEARAHVAQRIARCWLRRTLSVD
jgi:hypothetical protein